MAGGALRNPHAHMTCMILAAFPCNYSSKSMLGIIGQLLVLTSFVACLLAGFAYVRETQWGADDIAWKSVGRWSWGLSAAAGITAFGLLMYLFITQQYQFALVYQNASNEMPFIYQFSATWASQEGSFLLWIALTGLMGLAVIWRTGGYEAPVMAVFALCQFFLLSMVAGLQFGNLAIGSSPFAMLAERFADAPIFQSNPDFVPPNGTGLNDLLQNPWMAIHPPMMFVGFTAMLVPFAFAIAALWKRKYTEWVRPALPWTLFAVCMLGIGIAMGGYWAYVTLSFGGYWAWDPVENSSLVPWIVGIAAFHTMLIQKKSGHGHKAALFLSILAFILVVYSTFLTRSNVLEDLSVHSFVDLGLTSQLLVWIGTMTVVGFGLFAYRYSELPTPKKEPNTLSREFMIFSGAMLMCAMAAVILLGTSSPIIGHLFRESPATVPIEFYNKWTLPMAVVMAFLIGIGQLFWWNKMDVDSINRAVMKPMGLAVVVTLAVMVFTPFVEYSISFPETSPAERMSEAGFTASLAEFWEIYGQGLLLLLLLFTSLFAFFGNGAVLLRLLRGNPRMAGGAVTHIGFAIMVIGIITSSAFERPLPLQLGAAGQGQNESRTNFVAVKGETRLINGYEVTYHGQRSIEQGRTAYEVEFTDPRGRNFTVSPVAYFSEEMDQWIRHPEVKKYAEQDLFIAVTPKQATGSGEEDATNQLALERGEAVRLADGDYVVRFEGFESNVAPDEMATASEITVVAVVEMTHEPTGDVRTLRPTYTITEDRRVISDVVRVDAWDVGVSFTGMSVDSGEVNLTFDGVEVEPEDWVLIDAREKPLISLVWIGFIMLSFGFGIAIWRRAQDFKISRERGSV